MRAVDHYTTAEEYLDIGEDAELGSDKERFHVAAAQVHALLALAGATALQAYCTAEDTDGELNDWQDAAGGPS